MTVKRVGDRIIILKFIVEQDIFNVISAYAPQIIWLAEHFKCKILGGFRRFSSRYIPRRKVFFRGISK